MRDDDLPAYSATPADDPAATQRRFNRTHISRRDFDKAIAFIDRAATHAINTPEYEALLLSAVIYYARPFSGNERGSSPSSDPRLIVDVEGLLGEDLQMHKRMIEVRNKALAHAEFAYYPVQLLPTDSDPEIGRGFASKSQSWHVLNEHIDLAAFRRMAEALHQKCLNSLFDIHYAGIVKPKQ
jgi:TPR repeat protein